MNGVNCQRFDRDRRAARKTSQPRCAQCRKILDRRLKPKGKPRLCASCQTLADMSSYFELQRNALPCDCDTCSRSA